MKDKKLFKKWWFWAIVILALGIIGSLGQADDSSPANTITDSTQEVTTDDSDIATLPKLNSDDYKGEEGLIVYKELKDKGYSVDAVFENQALTDMNGRASTVFEPLNPSKVDDRQSVDAFVVGDLSQDGESVILNIAHQPTN